MESETQQRILVQKHMEIPHESYVQLVVESMQAKPVREGTQHPFFTQVYPDKIEVYIYADDKKNRDFTRARFVETDPDFVQHLKNLAYRPSRFSI